MYNCQLCEKPVPKVSFEKLDWEADLDGADFIVCPACFLKLLNDSSATVELKIRLSKAVLVKITWL